MTWILQHERMANVPGSDEESRSDVAVLLVTFLLTVIIDLTVAIEVGLVLACLLFMRRVMETTDISVIRNEIDPGTRRRTSSGTKTPHHPRRRRSL